MGKFSKNKSKGQPAVSTAALPDIVFMLLFFFMVAATIKTDNYTQYIKLEKPKGTEMQVLQDKDLIPNIYVGIPNDKYAGQFGTNHILVVNDKPSTSMDVIVPYLNEFKSGVKPEKWKDLNVQLTADKSAKMGYVNDIKTQIGYAQIPQMNFGVDEGDVNLNLQ